MAAAIVVMMGHFLHIKGSTSGFLMGTHLESILSSGAFAVVVFFGLSGIALRYQTEKYCLNFSWFTARLIRLMPVYWITLFVPLAGCYLIGVNISYPLYGFAFSALGLQAFFQDVAIPPVNQPLWSLSVEVYLSASLLVIGRFKRRSSFYIIPLLIMVAALFPSNLIVQGLPIFYLGYLLPSFKLTSSNNVFLKIVTILIPLSILILAPANLQDRHKGTVNLLISFSLAALILLASLIFAKSERTMLAAISQRSYSLYATHAPVLLFVDKTLFSNAQVLSAQQLLISLLLILFITEIVYRFIEVPSIKYSRRYLESRDKREKEFNHKGG
jgi:peptidoglycan/LPS O-acetylase OafA/YrhL